MILMGNCLNLKISQYDLYHIDFSLKATTKIHVWYQLKFPYESRGKRSGYHLLLPPGIVVPCYKWLTYSKKLCQ